MRRIQFSGILRYEPITQSRPVDETLRQLTRGKKIRYVVDFAVPADHTVKLEESEKIEIYLDLVRKLKKRD